MEFLENFRNLIKFGNFEDFRKFRIFRNLQRQQVKDLCTFPKLLGELTNKFLGLLEFLAIKNVTSCFKTGLQTSGGYGAKI